MRTDVGGYWRISTFFVFFSNKKNVSERPHQIWNRYVGINGAYVSSVSFM